MESSDSNRRSPWIRRPVMIDADLSKEVPWPLVKSSGYSTKFQLQASIGLTHVSYSERPQYLYVTGDSSHSIHVFWFADQGGTGEFDIINGELKHVDCHGCDFAISGTELIFSPLRRGGNRQMLGPRRDVPRNSDELFVAAFHGYRPDVPGS